MKKLLSKLFEKSIELNDFTFSDDQIKKKWIGNPPTTKLIIKEVEKKFGVKFPDDYKEMLLISNGFPAVNNIEPTFEPIENIIFYKDYEYSVIEIWRGMEGLDDEVENLKGSILIGGINGEQQFLLIPPKRKNDEWKYWKFANWIPGEEEYDNLTKYLKSVTEFMENEINENK